MWAGRQSCPHLNYFCVMDICGAGISHGSTRSRHREIRILCGLPSGYLYATTSPLVQYHCSRGQFNVLSYTIPDPGIWVTQPRKIKMASSGDLALRWWGGGCILGLLCSREVGVLLHQRQGGIDRNCGELRVGRLRDNCFGQLAMG